MDFEPIARTSLTDEVHEQLLQAILAGQFEVGQRLPSERDLAIELGVSRPAVREAIQRLAAMGVVRVRQGDGTIVQDPQHHCTTALLPALLWRSADPDPGVLAAIVELRALLAPGLARLAAGRATAEHRQRMTAAVRLVGTSESPVEGLTATLTLWDALVDAAGNVAMRLTMNAIHAALVGHERELARTLAPEIAQVDAYESMVDAIVNGRAAEAETAARTLLQPGSSAVLATLAANEALRQV